ncbi:MAG: TolC family protein, partial [Planctomycetota bacterium]
MIKKWQLILLAVLMITPGCKTTTRFQPKFETATGSTEHLYQNLQIQEPEISVESELQFDTGPLENFNFDDPGRFQRLSLDECISRALQESQVIRELGGTILRSPELIRSEDDPAITYTDPRVGEEAALAEFDANFSNQFLFQNNDRAFNSSFVGDQGILTQDLATNITNLTKRSATGGLFQLNHQIVYDRNNTPANRFLNDASYDTFLAAEFRQPLLQGAGTTFNRIAGPNNLPGVNTGVLIARANTDISLADFELGIRNLVSDVENAYWDLYFAYRDLEAKIEARNGAFSIWENLKARSGEKGEAEILQAEEQYYLFASRVQDAIHGQLNDGTRTNNGSTGGTFRGNSGVRLAERRLRLLTGLPVNDSSLIIPSDMPVEADVVFDWAQIKTDALQYRTELRRQRWVLKRAQLNHLANKNHLLPRLDLIGRYRVRGFGNDLFGNDGFDPTVPPGIDPQNDSDAFATFLNGDLQEWEVGMDLNIPIGYRRQMAAVRNSELNFMREKKVLLEQEREIIYGLSNAVGEIDRTGSLLDVNTSRLEASKKQYRAIQQDYENDDTTIDLVLESQRRVIDAKLDYFRVQVERMLAIKSVHFEKGTILAYHNVSLTESEWKERDIRQANEREMNKSGIVDYFCPGLKISNPSSTPEIGFATDETILLSEADQKAGEQSAELGRKILNGELKDSDAPQFAKTGKKTEPE